MRKLFLILICLKLSALAAFGQEEKPTIESVDVTGVAASRVCHDLRDQMNELVGKGFDQLAADEVAYHLQNELSEHVSAIRQVPGTEPDRIKLLFEFGPLDDDTERGNVNSRYTVEDVELQGVPESTISDQLREDMHKLAGEKLDQDRAQAIERRLSRELSPNRVVSRRVVKGADRDPVRLIYDVKNAPYLLLRDYDSYIVAHSKQSVSFGAGLDFGNGPNKFTLIAVNDGDRLLERYAGYGVRFENNRDGPVHGHDRGDWSIWFLRRPITWVFDSNTCTIV